MGQKLIIFLTRGLNFPNGGILTPLLNLLLFLAQPFTRESMCTMTDFLGHFFLGFKKAFVVHMLSRVRG